MLMETFAVGSGHGSDEKLSPGCTTERKGGGENEERNFIWK
jgi:hypothetical protein